jgi:hypothetical protein
MDGRIDGWIDGWIDKQRHGERQRDRQTNRRYILWCPNPVPVVYKKQYSLKRSLEQTQKLQ